MEGVGARLGRSSTRYGGPTTVFSGSVRKWKKRWVPLSNPNSNNNHSSSSSNNHRSNNNGNNINNASHLLIYKWTPISKDSSAALAEEPPRKKFRYVPVRLPLLPIRIRVQFFFKGSILSWITLQVAVIEEQKQEEAAAAAVKSDDEAQPAEDEAAAVEPTQTDGLDAKPEVNEVKEEETEVFIL